MSRSNKRATWAHGRSCVYEHVVSPEMRDHKVATGAKGGGGGGDPPQGGGEA